MGGNADRTQTELVIAMPCSAIKTAHTRPTQPAYVPVDSVLCYYCFVYYHSCGFIFVKLPGRRYMCSVYRL